LLKNNNNELNIKAMVLDLPLHIKRRMGKVIKVIAILITKSMVYKINTYIVYT